MKKLWLMLKRVLGAFREAYNQLVEQDAQRKFHEELRRERGRLESERQEKRHQEQLDCEHRRADGTSVCVYVYPDHGFPGGFLICQHCQAIIRPEERPGQVAPEFEHHLFDIPLFNEHYALTCRPQTPTRNRVDFTGGMGVPLDFKAEVKLRKKPHALTEEERVRLYTMPLEELKRRIKTQTPVVISNPRKPKSSRRRK